MPLDKVQTALKDLDKALTTFIGSIDKLKQDDVTGLLKIFKQLGEYVDELDATNDMASKVYKQLSYEVIPELFERLEMDSIKALGKNFVVGVRMNASIPADKREEGFRWLETHGLGSLIQPGVNPKTLSSAISNYFEENAEMPPADAMSIHKQRYTSVRKA